MGANCPMQSFLSHNLFVASRKHLMDIELNLKGFLFDTRTWQLCFFNISAFRIHHLMSSSLTEPSPAIATTDNFCFASIFITAWLTS